VRCPTSRYNAAILHGVLTYLNIPGVPVGMYRFGGTSAGSPQWAAITAIANQKAGHRLGFLNAAIYQIGRVNKGYPASFHDITDGTNSAVEFDSSNNEVDVTGFAAGIGWDATTGFGSPIDTSLVDYLITTSRRQTAWPQSRPRSRSRIRSLSSGSRRSSLISAFMATVTGSVYGPRFWIATLAPALHMGDAKTKSPAVAGPLFLS